MIFLKTFVVYFKVGRSIFWQPTGRSESLSNGMELWIGSFQSAILGWKPLLNVDGNVYISLILKKIFKVFT